MARTRSAPGSAAEDEKHGSSPTSSGTRFSLPRSTGKPPSLLVLPKRATPEAKIVTLPHPRHTKPSRYLVCPKTGFYEFTNISSSENTPRSWLIDSASSTSTNATSTNGNGVENDSATAQIVSKPNLFIATPIDPLFLILPALAKSSIGEPSEDKKRLFLSIDDYFDQLPSESSHLLEILGWGDTRALLEARAAAMCDTVEAGDETMYRLSREKTLATFLHKAKRLVEGDSLPPSLVNAFVTKALQAPVLHQQSASGPPATQATNGDTEKKPEDGNAPDTSDDNENGETVEFKRALNPTGDIIFLQQLRVAFDFLCESLVSPEVVKWLREGLSDQSACGVDFVPLDEYMAKLAELRAEVLASRAIGDYSRKRLRDEEEEEEREQKKRKMEEEKRRKANESRGVRDLKKVNTSGMKKLSAFFQKK